MRIVQLTPGSGEGFYCENCLRDVAAGAAMRQAGHDVMMLPMYLPLPWRREAAGEAGIFYGGINVYLQQKFRLFRRTPRWLDRLFDSPSLLRWVARRADGMTSAAAQAETILSMLRGEQGRQAKELERLVAFLASHPPDAVILSNALLAGLARQIRRRASAPVICLLQDEDGFLDALPEPLRTEAWTVLAERAGDVDAFVAVSEYYAGVMRQRLGLGDEAVKVVYQGVEPPAWEPADAPPRPPAVGFLSRACAFKGLDLLVEAFIALKGGAFGDLTLRVAGGMTRADRPFLAALRRRIADTGHSGDVEFIEAFDQQARQEFLRGLSVLSVPERGGEAGGLYVLEALAAGVPVVQPDCCVFPELLGATGGGLLFRPNDAGSLAEALAKVLGGADLAAKLSRDGRRAVLENFTAARMAEQLAEVCRETTGKRK